MSKKAAKRKAQRRIEKRLEAQCQQQQAVLIEKMSNAELSEAQKQRNQDELNLKQEKENRYQEDHSPQQHFIDKSFKPLLDKVVSLIGGDISVARQFVLEEVEAASMGNQYALSFVKNCGIAKSEYSGAMQNSNETVDGADGPQNFLNHAFLEIRNDQGVDLAVKLRIEVVDRVMQLYTLGKYSAENIAEAESQSPVTLAFDEYIRFCEKPDIGLHRLIQYILETKPLITNISPELEDHYTFVQTAALCGKAINSKKIPNNILAEGVVIELSMVSIVSVKKWHSAWRSLVDSGLNQEQLIRSIELGREVGNPSESRCAINIAPAICNIMSLIFREIADRPEAQQYAELMWDTSLIEGGIQGNINALVKYRSWVFNLAGVH